MFALITKITAAVGATLFAVTSFAACVPPNDVTAVNAGGADTHKLRVVASIFPPYDFARAVSGGTADVTMLLPPGGESHSFEPTAADMEKIENADVFLYIGGESDGWVERVLKSADGGNDIAAVPLIGCVTQLDEEIVGNMQTEDGADADTAESGDTGEIDEHIWTSPKNAVLITEKIAEVMGEKDPANGSLYKSNAAAYTAELNRLDSDFRDIADKAVRKTLVFGDRFPFRYFAEEYGLKYDAAFPGCSAENDVFPRTVTGLIDFVKAEKIPVVLKIELSSSRIADAVAKETGAKVMTLHSCHNISKEDFDKGLTYADIMKANEDVLKHALCDS